MKQPSGQEFARKEEEVPQARYQVLNYEARDSASSSGQSARIQVGKLAVCFKLSSEDLGGYVCIGIARILERRSEEHTSELQSRPHLVCRLLLEIKKEKTS